MFAAYTSQLELSNRKATSARAVLRPRRSPLLRCRHPKRCRERIIAKGKWSCAHFPKKRRPTWVASRDPPLLSALPHRHPSATSCWLAACSRPTIHKRELAVRRLKFPCPAQNDRVCDGVTRSKSSRGPDGLYKVAMSCSLFRSTRKVELHLC